MNGAPVNPYAHSTSASSDASGLADTWQVPWTLTDLLMAGALLLGIFAAAVVGSLVVRLFDVEGTILASRYLPGVSRYLPGIALLFTEAALIIPVWVFALHKYRCGWDRLGLRAFPLVAGLRRVAWYLFLAFVINGAWALLARSVGFEVQPNVLPIFGGGTTGLFVAFLAAGVIAPVVEELFFRGFLFAGLHDRFGFRWATLFSATFFAMAHFTPGALVPIFFLGVFFCLLYSGSGSLWPGILMHAVMNSLAVFASFIGRQMG